MNPTFRDISVVCAERLPKPGIQQWDRDGVLHLEGIIPGDLIDAYVEERTRMLQGTPKWRLGWYSPTPYLFVPTMKALALYRPLTESISPLIGGHEPGLHLCLTGFQSTQRAWHQDRYLNPETVGERYIAAWIVLDDVHEDSGPFEYIPGSQNWPVIERQKVWDAMKRMGQEFHPDHWPSDSQGWVGEACELESYNRGGQIKSFLGKKGDVLLWHASLIHRGSKPRNPTLERRSLIAHYSSIHARPDMPDLRREANGSYFFSFQDGYKERETSAHQRD